MKKLTMLLVLLVCLSLCGCNLDPADGPQDVQITAGQILAGMTVQDIFVEVTVNREPVACQVELTRFTDTGYYVMAADEPVPADFYGRLDVYYVLPKGVELDGIQVAMECDGGAYDGTGSLSSTPDGCVVAWSHAIYGTEPTGASGVQVHIKAGKLEAGMTRKDVAVEVTVGGTPVECNVGLTRFTPQGDYVLTVDETVTEDFYGRLDVFYPLPDGVQTEDIHVTMECDGGTYGGTGRLEDEYGNEGPGWSYAIYGAAPVISANPDVKIIAGKIETGMTPNEISVEVIMDGVPVAHEAELTCFTESGYYVMAPDEAVPAGFFGRLDVYYSLPKGVELEDITVTMECDGGEYDGTGSVSSDANGCVVAWSHAIYGTEPAPTEHTHTWVEDPAQYASASCSYNGYTTFVCDCGESWKEPIPALGHNIVTDSYTAPTCTQPGHESSHCTRCGALYLNEFAAAGHIWSAWAYENGRQHKHMCSVCNAEESENHTIPSGSVTCTGCGADIIN